MNIETIFAYGAVAWIAILSPAPAILLALRNGIAFGVRSVVWASLGNVTGIFLLSTAAMLGLGTMLKSSALLFGMVKILGALYLLYVGIRHLLGRSSITAALNEPSISVQAPPALALFKEGFLLAATNPKPILFFTALFPQFIDVTLPLLSQFFVLTGIFMFLSFVTLLGYASVGGRARALLTKPWNLKWVNRIVGGVFVSLGAVLLALRRPTT